MRHEVLVALGTPHINPDDSLRPGDSITQFPLTDRVGANQCGVAVGASTF